MKYYKFRLFISFALLIGMFFIAISCKKKNNSVIPYVYVNLYIYPSEPLYNKLNAVGGWVYVSGGSRGIVVYRRSNDEFVAYDRHCTYQPDNSCGTVNVNSSQIMAVDSCCGSQFVLTDGSVAKAPATISLKAYQTSFDGNALHIFN